MKLKKFIFCSLFFFASNLQAFDLFELSLSSTTQYANKFTDVEVTLNITTPSGNKSVRGFHDGGNVWKCRYLPLESGNHTYQTVSPDSQLNGITGQFQPTTGTQNIFIERGPIKIHPDNPHAVAQYDGTPFFWNGDTEWFILSHTISQANRLAAIDFLATKKVNNLLMCLANSDSTLKVFPWPGTTSPTTHFNFDLTRLRVWEDTILYMQNKGIVADLWFYADDSTSIIPAALSAAEDLYFRYMLARFGAYPNVTWNLALEYSEYRTASWVVNRAALVKTERPNAFLGVHQVPDDTYDFPGNQHLDHTSLERFTGPDWLNNVIIQNRILTANAGRPIPIFHEEFAIEGANNPDPNILRRDAWAITCGGGFYKAASLGFWIGTPYQSALHFDYCKILYETIIKCKWWQMSPQNTLVQNGGVGKYALASTNEEILIYSISGASFTVNLTNFIGQFNVEYTNPLNGNTQNGVLTGGNSNHSLSNPFGSGEVAVRIFKNTNPPDNQPPIAQNGSGTTLKNVAVLVQLVFSDTDGPGPNTFQIIQQPSSGVLSGSGNDRTYTPNNNFTGNDFFTWIVNDGLNDSNVATFDISVTEPSGEIPALPDAARVTGSAIQLKWDDNSNNETAFHIERRIGEETEQLPSSSGEITLVAYNGTATPPSMQLSGPNTFKIGSLVVNDRSETWSNVPADLMDLPRLLCARSDRMKGVSGQMYTVSLPGSTIIYLPLDERYNGAKLPWMGPEWTTTGLNCTSSVARLWNIWQREASGQISLGVDSMVADGMCFVFDVQEIAPIPSQWEEIGIVAANITEFIDTPAPDGQKYFYRVRAKNEAGFSAYSNEISITVTVDG